MGPLPDGSYLFVVVDYFSRYFEIDVLKTTTSEKLVKSLETIFCRHGYPEILKTDNGPNLVSAEFEHYLQQCGIIHRTTTPLWPQANGQVERQNRTLLKSLKIAEVEGKDWKNELNQFLIAYRSTPHSTNRKIRTKLPDLGTDDESFVNSDKDKEMKQKAKDYFDLKRSAKENQIVPGDKVLVKQDRQNKLTPFILSRTIQNDLVTDIDNENPNSDLMQAGINQRPVRIIWKTMLSDIVFEVDRKRLFSSLQICLPY